MENKEAVAAFSALGHEGRLEIYRLLVVTGPEGMTVGAIAKKLKMPGATLSFHLSQLQDAGLVLAKRNGRQLIQTADFDQMNDLVAYLTKNCCGSDTECAPVCKPAAPKKSKPKKTVSCC